MLSGLRLLPRQSALLRQWCRIGQSTRLVQRQGEDESSSSPSPAAAAATAAEQPPPVSADQLAATFVPLQHLLARCRSLEEALSLASRREMTNTEALQWLTSVVNRTAETGRPPAELTAHPCYQAISDRLVDTTDGLPAQKLLGPTRALLELGVPPQDRLLASLVNDLVWNLRKMTMRQLVQSFCLARRFSADPRVKQLYTLSLEMIQRRWVEITAPEEILPILKNSDAFSGEFVRRVEDRALDAAGHMSSGQASRLLGQLAALGRRPLPLLRALSFHAARQPDTITVKDCVRTLYALQKLNFPDQVLLERLGRDLVTETPAVEQAHVLSSAITAAGLLRWRNPEFLEAAASWYEKHTDLLKPQDIVALIITLATVNYRPTNADSLIPALLSRCPRGQLPSAQVWLNVVWSLAVLGRDSPELLRSVLEPAFCRELADSGVHLGARLKVLNLAALARLRDGYQGPVTAAGLGLADASSPCAPPRSRESEALQKAVLEALVAFLPPPRYLRVGGPPAAGIAVDAEFAVAADGAPVPCERFGSALPGSENQGEKVPDGTHRVAVCTWTYRDYTLDSVEPGGHCRLTAELLERSGYRVLEVSHAELRPQDSVVTRVKLLRQKVRDLVAR